MIAHKKKSCITLLIAFVFTFAFGASLVQAVPAPAPTVGYVNSLYLINNHPDTPKANEELRTVQEQLKKEFEAKSAGLNDKEKRELASQLDQQIEQKRQELLRPISEKVMAAIREVRAEKGLSTVLERNVVIDGGVDITEEVLKKFK